MDAKETLDISREGNVAIARFKSCCICDVSEIANASTSLRQYIDTHRPSGLVFDFSGVRFFSSQVLGLLLEARARLQLDKGRVSACALTSQLERVFRVTNLDSIFPLHPDRDTAVEKLSRPVGSSAGGS